MAKIDPKALVQLIQLEDDAFQIQTPCAMCISGPSQSGTTNITKRKFTKTCKITCLGLGWV